MRRLRDRGECGDRDWRSRKVVLDQEQQKVPGRVFLGDRNKLLERLTDPFEKRDNSEQFVLCHPIAAQPACRGSSRSSGLRLRLGVEIPLVQPETLPALSI